MHRLRRSRSTGQAHPAAGFLVATLALATAALLFSLCLGSTPAAAAGFYSCTTQSLENEGILKLSANHAKCRLARQVVFDRQIGDKRPRGFSPLIQCASGCGLPIQYIYIRYGRPRMVKFWLREKPITDND